MKKSKSLNHFGFQISDFRCRIKTGIRYLLSVIYFLAVIGYLSSGICLAAPAVITNLTALTGSDEGRVTLKWTTPGAEQMIGGKASSYAVKYLGHEDWANARDCSSQVSNPTRPIDTDTYYGEDAYTYGLRGEYFVDDGDPAGSWQDANLVFMQVDKTVQHGWDTGSSLQYGAKDDYSTRWKGEIYAYVSGDNTYAFELKHDDYGYVWVNGTQVCGADGNGTHTGSITLSGPAWYTIEMKHYENGGASGMQLKWDPDNGTNWQQIPKNYLRPQWSGSYLTCSSPTGMYGLKGEYYKGDTNDNWTINGTLQATQLDRRIAMWGGNGWNEGFFGQLVGASDWKVRWQGLLKADSTGVHYFKIKHDDYVGLYIDGTLVGEETGDNDNPPEWSRDITTTGWHTVEIRWHQGGGNQGVEWVWKPPGATEYSVVPTDYLCPPRDVTETITGLPLGWQYFNIKTAKDSNWSGESDWAKVLVPGRAPGNITCLVASMGSSPGQVDLSWTAPADNDYDASSGNAVQYDIRYAQTSPQLFFDDFNDGNANGWTETGGTWSAADNTYKHTALGENEWSFFTAYGSTWTNYAVEAKVCIESGGNQEGAICARAQSSSPAGNHYRLNWYGGNSELQIKKNDGGTEYLLAQKLNFSLTPGTTYTFRLEVDGDELKGYINGELELWTYDTRFSSGTCGLRGGNDSIESYDDVRVIDLDWLDNADSKTKDATPFSPGSSVSDTVESLDAGTVYYFLVKTKDDVSSNMYWSGISNLDSAQACSLNAPVAEAFSNCSTSQIRANWSDPGGNPWGTKYYCENQTAGTNSGNTSNLYWDSTGLSANTEYTFRVKCTSGTQESGWTNLGSTWTWANPPTSAGHSANTTTSITWTWASGGAQKDYYAWDNDGHNSGWTTATSTQTCGYSANTEYTFYVKARNGANVETSTASASAYTSASVPGEGSPKYTNISSWTITANWTANGNPAGTEYYCEYDTDPNFGTPDGYSGWITDTSSTFTALSPATKYYFQVKAKNGDGDETAWCNLGEQWTDDDWEDNDTSATGTEIPSTLAFGTTSPMRVVCYTDYEVASDTDWYKVSIAEADGETDLVINVYTDHWDDYKGDLDVIAYDTDATTIIGKSAAPAYPGWPGATATHEIIKLFKLTAGTYYFKVYGWNNSQSTYTVCVNRTLDTTKPAVITSLKATSNKTTGGRVDLAWTSPGDDAMLGTASSYSVKYATYEITSSNWNDASSYDASSWEPKGYSGYGLKAEYYDDDVTGQKLDTKKGTRIDPRINMSWGTGGPYFHSCGNEGDSFSMRWTGFIKSTETATYYFWINHDDGVKFWIDDTLIIDDWHDCDRVSDSEGANNDVTDASSPTLYKGWHKFKVEYYEATSDCQVDLRWARSNVGYTNAYPIPFDYLRTDPIDAEWYGLKGEYHDGTSWSDFKFNRYDRIIDDYWNDHTDGSIELGSPDGPTLGNDNFSIRWTGLIKSTSSGSFTYKAWHDDDFDLWIDNEEDGIDSGDKIIDTSSSGEGTSGTTNYTSAGWHEIKMELKALTGTDKCSFENVAEQCIKDSELCPPRNESKYLVELDTATKYWVAMKATDDRGNESGLSNCTWAWTDDNCEDNDNNADAYEIQDGSTIATCRCMDYDWFKIYFSQSNKTLHIIMHGMDGQDNDIDLYLYNDAGTELASSTGATAEEEITKDLSGGGTYYYIKVTNYGESARDNNYSLFCEIIDAPPGAITDLAATLGTGYGEIDLQWTAVGEDGYTGTASEYEVKYSSVQPITDAASWDSAIHYDTSTWQACKAAGQTQSGTLAGLNHATKYWFAIKTKDAGGNWSNLPTNLPVYRYTRARDPTAAAFSDQKVTSIRANWNANGNSDQAEYYCECKTSPTGSVVKNSGWITGLGWSCDGLSEHTSYYFQVKARNGDGVEASGGFIELGVEWTTTRSGCTGDTIIRPGNSDAGRKFETGHGWSVSHAITEAGWDDITPFTGDQLNSLGEDDTIEYGVMDNDVPTDPFNTDIDNLWDGSGSNGFWAFGGYENGTWESAAAWGKARNGFDLDDEVFNAICDRLVEIGIDTGTKTTMADIQNWKLTSAKFKFDLKVYTANSGDTPSYLFLYAYIQEGTNIHKLYGDQVGSVDNETPPWGNSYVIGYDPASGHSTIGQSSDGSGTGTCEWNDKTEHLDSSDSQIATTAGESYDIGDKDYLYNFLRTKRTAANEHDFTMEFRGKVQCNDGGGAWYKLWIDDSRIATSWQCDEDKPMTSISSTGTIFTDDFNDGDANGWIFRKTDGTDASSTWQVTTSSELYHDTLGENTYAFFDTYGSTWTDYAVEAKVKIVDSGNREGAIVARAQDSEPWKNHYKLNWCDAGGWPTTLRIDKVVASTETTLASKSLSLTPGNWYTFKLEVSSNVLKGWVDGTLHLICADGSFSSGKIGLRGGNNSQQYYDDVKVYDPGKGGTHYNSVSVSLSAKDPCDGNVFPTGIKSGYPKYRIKTNDGNFTDWTTYTTSFSTGVGRHCVEYYSRDDPPSDVANRTEHTEDVKSSTYTVIGDPSNLTFDEVNISSITLSWCANGNWSGVTYELEESPDNSSWSNVYTGSNLTYAHTSLGVNTKHYYRVRTTHDGVSSGWVTPSPAYKYTKCKTPSSPSLTVVSSTTITCVVDENGNPSATTFSIKVSSTGATKYVQANGTLGASAVYQTKADWGGAAGQNVINLTPNTEWTFSVDAKNGDGVTTPYGLTASKYTHAAVPGFADFSDRTTSSIKANWTANGNPSGTQYYCEYDTHSAFGSPDGNSGWTTNLSTQPCSLSEATTYYFHVKARNDDASHETGWCDLGSTTTLRIAPGDINDLSATTSFYPGKIELSWTAVGDDGDSGDITGGKYWIKYSSDGAHGWDQMPYSIQWDTNTSPGDGQSRTISSLTDGTTYYFYIKTRDEVSDNWSALSNLTSTWAQWIIKAVSFDIETHNFGKVALGNSTYTVTAIVVTNDGNVPLDYGLSCDTTTAGGSPWFPGNVGEDNSVYNRFILYSVFNSTKPAEGTDFGSADTVERTTRWAQETSTFTITGAYTGVNVPCESGSDQRNIWFRLDLPETSATSQEQEITVTITAQ